MTVLVRCYVRLREQTAQSMTEYVLIMSVVAIACLAVYNLMGGGVSSKVSNVASGL